MLQETIDLKFLDNLGITRLGLKYCPSIDINDETGEPYICGTHSDYFIVRYNKKNISLQKRYDDYANNRDVQGCLKDLDLDPDMFWYVLLFVYDYCKILPMVVILYNVSSHSVSAVDKGRIPPPAYKVASWGVMFIHLRFT